MTKNEKVVSAVVAGVAMAAAADIVLHREKIQRSLQGQKQHYKTKDRGAIARLTHALATQTTTGRAVGRALQRINPPRLESK